MVHGCDEGWHDSEAKENINTGMLTYIPGRQCNLFLETCFLYHSILSLLIFLPLYRVAVSRLGLIPVHRSCPHLWLSNNDPWRSHPMPKLPQPPSLLWGRKRLQRFGVERGRVRTFVSSVSSNMHDWHWIV